MYRTDEEQEGVAKLIDNNEFELIFNSEHNYTYAHYFFWTMKK